MPKLVDHDQRRAEIIRGLWSVISERGIEGVTFQAVAQATGISVGRVQHYFSSKEELVRAGCEAMAKLAAPDHLAAADVADPWTALVGLLTDPIPKALGFRPGAAVWYAYVALAIVDPDVGTIIAEATHRMTDEVAALLEAGGASAEAATRLVGLSTGLAQLVLIGGAVPAEAIPILCDEVTRLQESVADSSTQTA